MSLWCSKKEKFFKFFFSDVWIRITIENEIYFYINGFLKYTISKKTSYILGNKKFTRKICVLNLRKKRKSIFLRVIIRYYRWKKITKEMNKIIIKSTYRGNNRTKFKKCITRGKLVHFRSTIDASGSRTRRMQFIIIIFVKKVFFVSTYVKNLVVKLHVPRLGLRWAFRI